MSDLSVPSAPAAMTQHVDPPSAEISLLDLFALLRRRRWLILSVFLIGLVSIALVLAFLTPYYRATVSVMVDPRQANVVDLEQVLSGLPANAETVQSEMEVLRSRELAGKVVDRLKLTDNAEFNPDLTATGEAPVTPTQEQADRVRNQAINRLLRALTVKVSGRSRVIAISVESRSPQLAATIANTMADLYVSGQLEARMVATRNASAWLNQRLEQLRVEAEAAELAVSRFRTENKLGPDTRTSSRSGESAATLRDRLALLEGLRDATVAPSQWPDDELRQLFERVTALLTEQTNLASHLGSRHPRMIEVAGQLAEARSRFSAVLESRIADAQRALAGSAPNGAPESRVSSLGSNSRTAGGSPGEVAARLRTLEREAEASRALFETFLTRYKQTTEQQGLEQADARVISRASAPPDPSFPDTRLFLLLGALGSLGLGLVLALVVERLDAGFRSSDQIEARLGLPTIAMVPALRSLGVKQETPEAYITAKPNSAFAEAVRGLRMSLLLSDVDNPPRVVMVTSALPGEGKTSLCLTLARIAAMGGERVVVVDADLRRPRVHTALGVENRSGLVEVLSGRAKVDQVLHVSTQDGSSLDYISAGLSTPHATELVRSQAMKNLVKTLSVTYSLVIIDTPPVLPVADAKLLSLLADKLIYVVRWRDTHRATVQQAIKQLREVKANFAGVVLNQVDVRRHAEYSYSDSGYYYGRYRKYYTE